MAKGLPGYALLATALAGLWSTDAAALSPGTPASAHPAAGLILIQDAAKAPPGGEPAAVEARAPFAELNEALAAARARLEELSKAATAAAAASQARQELESVRQENQRLQAQLAALRASRDELREVAEGNEARLSELSETAEAAVAEAKRIEEELVTMRWQNAQLNTSLARAETARERLEEDARKAQAELASKVESLSASAERSAAEIARLRGELAGAEERLTAAISERESAEARIAELQETVQSAQARSRQFDQEVATLRSEIEEAVGARDQARQQVAELQSRAERLRSELDGVSADRAALEEEVGMLRAAANSAADAARQNLLAVEDRIRELNDALAGVAPAAGEADGGASLRATPAGPRIEAPIAAADEEQRGAAEPAERRPAVAAQRVKALPAVAPRAAARRDAEEARSELDLIKSANAAEPPAGPALDRLMPDLSPEMRLQVQGLLVDLGAKAEERGVRMTVPGSSLFELDSDTIEPTAYDTLAKVAELIDAYKSQQVMIVGHTDSLGDESYNKALSQRRASLVKQFFVENFEIDAARLSIDGKGEAQPIAPNDTLAGRRANRRIDVLILD